MPLLAREDGFTTELMGNSITTFILQPVLFEDAALSESFSPEDYAEK